MREILFKAKQCGTDKWIIGNVAGYAIEPLLKKGVVLFVETLVDGKMITRYCQPGTVCQYTGILDKENKRVFEGDILIANDMPIINASSGETVGKSTVKYMEIGFFKNGIMSVRTCKDLNILSSARWSRVWSHELITRYYTVTINIRDIEAQNSQINNG